MSRLMRRVLQILSRDTEGRPPPAKKPRDEGRVTETVRMVAPESLSTEPPDACNLDNLHIEVTVPLRPNPFAPDDKEADSNPDFLSDDVLLLGATPVGPGSSTDWDADEPTQKIPLSAADEAPRELDDLREGLAEVDFFLGQGLCEDALEGLQALAEKHGPHPQIDERLVLVEEIERRKPAQSTQVTSPEHLSYMLHRTRIDSED